MDWDLSAVRPSVSQSVGRHQPARPGGTQRRVTNARGDFSSFSLPSAGMFLSNVVENIKLEGVEPQSASPKNWNSRPLHLLLDAAAEGKKSGWSPRRTTATSEGAVLFSFGEG